MNELFDQSIDYPESVLLSIYKAYPRPTGRSMALKRICEALDRICQGEIDGQPRTQAEAIEFLRVKVEEGRRQMGAREKKFIPHMATWLHQRRYLRPEVAVAVERPTRLMDCIEILCEYPMVPKRNQVEDNLDAFLPALMAIDKALDAKIRAQPAMDDYYIARRLKSRTELYAMAVKQWPVEDLKFVPNPKRWFEESRYDQPSESWQRQPANDYVQGRQQLGRVFDELAKTGDGSQRPN
jgi:hypothetical protein